MTDVLVLAVVSALDAGLLAAAIVLMGRPRPARNLLAYLIGGMGISIAVGVIILVALHGSAVLTHPKSSTTAVIAMAAGALLLAVAAVVLSGRTAQWHPRRRTQPAQRRSHRPSLEELALGHDSLWIAWAAGALYSAPGAYYLAALALLAKLDRPTPINVVAIVGFNVIMFAFIELPLLGFLFAPDHTRNLAHRLNGWMARHKRALVVTAAGTGGAYLLVSGLSDLL